MHKCTNSLYKTLAVPAYCTALSCLLHYPAVELWTSEALLLPFGAQVCHGVVLSNTLPPSFDCTLCAVQSSEVNHK